MSILPYPATVACSLSLGLGLALSCAARAQDESPVALETVVVTGTHAQVEGSGVVLRVPVDPLEATDLADVLSSLPGVQVRAGGGLGSYSEASLRGSTGRQVRVLLDGLPLDVGGGEATSLSLISPQLLEEVTVYQGRVPVGLGSGLAGSIDLKTRKVLPEPVVGTATVGTLGERQASAGAQLGGLVQLFAGHQEADNDFRYVNPYKPFDPDDPERDDQEPRHNAATGQSWGLLRYRGPLVLTLHGVDDDQELPTRLNGPSTDTSLDTRTLGAAIAMPEGSTWKASLSHRYTDEHYRDPKSELGPGSPQDVKQQSRATQLEVGRQWGSFFDQVRIEHQEFRTHDLLQATSGPSARRLSLGNGAEVAWGAPQGIRLEGSLHVAWSRDASGAQEDEEWRVEPALGLSRSFGSCVGAANLGRRERLPNFFERYGDRGLFTGNPGLQPERAWYGDVGGRCAWQKTPLRHATVTLFGQDLRDAISPAYSAQGVGRSINTARAQIYGMEVSTGGGGSAWAWELSGTWQHTEDRSDIHATRGNPLPGRFENQLSARVERTLLELTFAYQFRFESGQYYDSTQLLEADPRREHDLSVRGVVHRVGWSLQWLNVGNDNFEQFNGFPTPGERVRFSLTWPETRRPAFATETRSTP